MNLTGKLNAGVASMAKVMKNSADNYKLDAKIAEQQEKIKSLTKEIGNLVLVRLEDGVEMYPEIMERYEAIKEAREAIVELEKGRKVTKVVCPECGMKTSVEMNYCGKCGTKLPEGQTEEKVATDSETVISE